MQRSIFEWVGSGNHGKPYEEISTHVDDPREFVNELYRTLLEVRHYFSGDNNCTGFCIDDLMTRLEGMGADPFPLMTDIFPAAQKVLDAVTPYPIHEAAIAAALRAAALYCKRDATILLAIAGELEGL
jgi:hypothetical protein